MESGLWEPRAEERALRTAGQRPGGETGRHGKPEPLTEWKVNLRLEHIFGEHEDLRSRLSSLCNCSTRQQPLPRPWMEFSEELRFFRRQLVAHEAAEFELWQQAYGTDVGTKD